MKRNRRWIWLLIAALIMSTCVSACGSSGSEADEENRKEEADVDSDTREDDSSDGGFFSQFSFTYTAFWRKCQEGIPKMGKNQKNPLTLGPFCVILIQQYKWNTRKRQ